MFVRILDSFLAKHSFLKTLQIMEQHEITQNLKVMTLQMCGCPLKHWSSDLVAPGHWAGDFESPNQQGVNYEH